MINPRRIFLLGLVLTTSVSAEDVPAQEQEVLEAIIGSARTYEPAEIVKRAAPSYPRIELQKNREAWVQVAYCIDEEGLPQNLAVMDSGGSKAFERAALSAARNWRFKPAEVDGKPSWQSNNQTYIRFAIEGRGKGASRRFISDYRRLGKLIDSGALDEADELFQRLHANDDLNLYEISRLWTQRVNYALARGDYDMADLAIHRATASDGEWIEEDTYAALLAARISIELHLGHYSATFEAYDSLVEVAGAESESVGKFRPIIEELRSLVDGNNLLQTNAEVQRRGECYRCNDSYSFTPVRRNFTFANVNGELASIEMRCTHKRFESTISDLIEWNIPETWGKCSIQVYGEPGTTFEVLQFPDS